MEIFASASPFETNLTLQTRNSFRDVSFSSYLNKAEENLIMKLTDQTPGMANGCKGSDDEDGEIGVFGAEKYFKGEMEDADGTIDRRFVDTVDVTSKMHLKRGEDEDFDDILPVKQTADQTKTHTPSVRSNASWNSRSGLLPRANQAPGKTRKGNKPRIFARFGCNCIDKKSTEISEKRFIQTNSKSPTRMIDFSQKTEPLSSKCTQKNPRDDFFSFPVLNSNDSSSNSNSKSGNLAGKVQEDNNGGRLSLGRKLCLLNDWDVGVPLEDQTYIPSNAMYNHDVDSDTSSDLFEIESFSTTGNSSFLAHRTSVSNCYAPSEVSIAWSVVTASAADFSVASDYEDVRTGAGAGKSSGRKATVMENKEEQKKRPGILSGCTNHKAVRVAGDEYTVVGGRRRSSESMVTESRFREVNNVGRFDPTRGSYRSDVCPMSKGMHTSHMLYIQR